MTRPALTHPSSGSMFLSTRNMSKKMELRKLQRKEEREREREREREKERDTHTHKHTSGIYIPRKRYNET